MSLQLSGVAEDYAKLAGVAVGSVQLRVNTFSDFVVVSTESSPQGLDMLCFVVWSVAREWLSKGFLSRGGIARGKVIHVDAQDQHPAVVFGPAFIDAYLLEPEVADYPRVVLSRRVRRDVVAHQVNQEHRIKALQKLVIPCEDGPMCLDLFAHLRRNGFTFLGKDHAPEAKQFADALRTHLDEGADVPRFYRRSLWLVQRFNQAVERTPHAALVIEPNSL